LMRPFGFSTGALAPGDFPLALKMLEGIDVGAIELSSLRVRELPALVAFVRHADLSRFAYVSIHAPTDYDAAQEAGVIEQLAGIAGKNWPIVVHPDVMREDSLWERLGSRLCIENMDKRKPVGRTAEELAGIFDRFPDARMCFDIGHARQVDTSMTEAYRIVRDFSRRIEQVHISVVTTSSKHDLISPNAAHAFRRVASLIPGTVPAILETPAKREQIRTQLHLAAASLDGALGGSAITPGRPPFGTFEDAR
jgi:hypothetical protein